MNQQGYNYMQLLLLTATVIVAMKCCANGYTVYDNQLICNQARDKLSQQCQLGHR